MEKKGKFISIEGIEGAGKSTVTPAIADFLEQHQIPFIKTREPGGTFIAEKIREVLLCCQDEVMDPKTELLLMFAARIQHVEQVIMPALAQGTWVISDRFVDASYAYQGGGRGLPIDLIAYLDRVSLQHLQPDLTFLLDASVELCLSRARTRGQLDRIEQEQQDFFSRVRAVYLDRAQQAPQRIKVIDVGQPIEQVLHAVLAELGRFTAMFSIEPRP